MTERGLYVQRVGRTAVAAGALSLLAAPHAQAHPVEDEPAGSPYEGDLVLFVNRCATGQTIVAGEQSDSTLDVSSILADDVDFFPYPHGEDSWQALLVQTRAIVAPFRIVVTDVDPSPAAHDEVVVCGNALEAGFAGLPGAAPLRCEPGQNPISFVFAEDIAAGDDRERRLAELVVQEAAHAWSLDHVLGCDDMMGYDGDCGPRTLIDAELDCGNEQLSTCACGGKEQNSFHVIAGLFGTRLLDRTPPSVTLVEPADNEVFAEDDTIVVTATAEDDFVVTTVRLWLDDALIAEDPASAELSWPLTKVPEGDHALRVDAIDQDGNVGTSAEVTIAVHVSGAEDANSDGPQDSGQAGTADFGDGDDSSSDTGDDATSAGGDGGPAAPGGCACQAGPSATTDDHAAWPLAWLIVVPIFVRRRN